MLVQHDPSTSAPRPLAGRRGLERAPDAEGAPTSHDRLFIYGTLAPGRPHEHVLADVDGRWEPASARGHLHQQGWGAALGFPGIILGEDGPEVHGALLTADSLADHWA